MIAADTSAWIAFLASTWVAFLASTWIAFLASTWIAFLEGEDADDTRLLDRALRESQVLMVLSCVLRRFSPNC